MTNYEYKYSQKQQKEGWNKQFEELERRWNEHVKQTRIQPTGRNTGSRVWFGDEYRNHFPLKEQQSIPSFQISCWQSNAINPQRKQQMAFGMTIFPISSIWTTYMSLPYYHALKHICRRRQHNLNTMPAWSDWKSIWNCDTEHETSTHVSFIYLECIITIEEEGIKTRLVEQEVFSSTFRTSGSPTG